MRLSKIHRASSRLVGAGLTTVLTTVLAAGLGGCGGAAETPVERRPPLVEAVAARSGTLPRVETVSGGVRAQNQVAIRPEISGSIIEVMVKSGEAVDRGQPLVRLDGDTLRDQLHQTEAGVRLAEAAAAEARARVGELEARVSRSRALAEAELISHQEIETQEAQLTALVANAELAVARVEQAQATAAESRSALAKTVVRSPVAGRVGQRRAEVGMRVDTDTVLFVVGNLEQVMVELPLTESMMDHVEEGMPVVVEPRGATGDPIRATLSRISPFLAEESFTTIGEIDLDNRDGRLRPGNFVTVRILYGQSQRATLVPTSAIWEDPETGRRGLFVVDDGAGLGGAGLDGAETTAKAPPTAPGQVADAEKSRAVVFRTVEILAEGEGTVGVEGVREGEWVVVVGQHLLAEQARDTARQPGMETAEGPMRATARVRPTSWERVQALQGLKREDLLADFLAKQQKVAAALGAEIPQSEDAVQRVLDQASAAADSGAN